VLALVIVLIVTNLMTAGALILFLRLRPVGAPEPGDSAVRDTLDALARAGSPPTRQRQFISIEILNPIELAATRGRVLGIAGSLAPGFTRRVVYDQTAKILRRQLVEQHVAAEVHVHTLRPAGGTVGADSRPDEPGRTLDVETANYVDDIDVPVEQGRDQPPV
jgi:hypothetical protein